MAAKRKRRGLSKTERLRRNIKATIRRREAQGWQFDPLDKATVETGNYQQLKSLQRDNYRKLYEHAQVVNPETGQVMTGRQAQLRGRWSGDMWEGIDMPEPDDTDVSEQGPEDDTGGGSGGGWDQEDLWEGKMWYDRITSWYGLDWVNPDLLQEVQNMIDNLLNLYGDVIYVRIAEHADKIIHLVEQYVYYYDPELNVRNERIGDSSYLQELRQLLDPNVSLEDLDSYNDRAEDSDWVPPWEI